MLTIRLGSRADLEWAQATVEKHHYLHQRVDNRARPMVYVIGDYLGLIMAGIPHATKNRGWWGYPGLITQWQVVDLCRIWLDPSVQPDGWRAKPDRVPGFVDRKGVWRPAVASWAIYQVLARIQQDWVSMWPPVFPWEPYHVRLVISYHDPQYHRGTIYRATKALPMYTDEGQPVPGPSGKYGWAWKLPQPEWTWEEIPLLQPRNLRLAM